MEIYVDASEIQSNMGTPPIMVDENRYCDECRHYHEFEKCPKCGSWIMLGFGLMFGGFGAYKFCENSKCDWFYKELVDE